MRGSGYMVVLAALLTLAACSGGGSGEGPGPNTGVDTRAAWEVLEGLDGGTDTGGDPPAPDTPPREDFVPAACEWLVPADPPEQAGIVIVGHFLSEELKIYRLDRSHPESAGYVELGEYTHDMALDPYSGLLAVVQDVARAVTLLRVTAPFSPDAELPAPDVLAVIDVDNGDVPRFVRVDPLRDRLFVLAGLPVDAETTDIMHLHVFDVADPAAPAALGVHDVPTSVSLDLDPLAGLLFLAGMKDDRLYLYDIADGSPVLRPGEPIALRDLYPQENSTAFQARNLTVDPWQGRVLAARSQGVLSEVIAFDYPAAVPRAPGDCPVRPDHGSLVQVDDFFDVDLPPEDRPNLLDAYTPLPIPGTGEALFLADAWNGSASTALLVGLDAVLDVKPGCGDYEGFGCWIRSVLGGQAGFHLRTDGAACLDATRKIAAVTSIDAWSDEDPGSIHFFTFGAGQELTPRIPADGDTLPAGALPVAAVCR